MPAEAPEELTDPEEIELWRTVSRAFEDYKPDLGSVARSIAFSKVLLMFTTRLEPLSDAVQA